MEPKPNPKRELSEDAKERFLICGQLYNYAVGLGIDNPHRVFEQCLQAYPWNNDTKPTLTELRDKVTHLFNDGPGFRR